MKPTAMLSLVLVAALGGCGGASSSASPADDSSGGEHARSNTDGEVGDDGTVGIDGDVDLDENGGRGRIPEPSPPPPSTDPERFDQATTLGDQPIVMPPALPAPGIPRAQLAADLRGLWDTVDAALASPPPPPTDVESMATLSRWTQGSFHPWLQARMQVLQQVHQVLRPLEQRDAVERGLGHTLVGRLVETTFAELYRIPVPARLLEDAEMRQAFEGTLRQQLQPVLNVGLERYTTCRVSFEQAASVDWSEWATYCRGREATVQAYLTTPQPGADAQ